MYARFLYGLDCFFLVIGVMILKYKNRNICTTEDGLGMFFVPLCFVGFACIFVR